MPAPSTFASIRFLFYAVVFSLLLSACEDSVSPILESDRQFTLFGTLDMERDTQYVRVIPIRPTLASNADAPLTVSVTSIDRTSGETLAWRDSTVQFANGTSGHVFFAPLRVQPGHTYRLEVQPTNADLVTSVETTVPAQPEAIVMPEVTSSSTTPGGALVRARQLVQWRGITDKPFRIEQWYRFFTVSTFGFVDVQLPYVPINRLAAGTADVWEMDLDLVRDRDSLATMITLDASTALAGLGLTITVLDAAFVPPGGVFDREVLVQPGTFSNVENGFGFVGSVGRFSVEWLVADSTARLLRYTPLRRALGKDAAAVLTRLKQNTAIGDRR